MGLTLKNSFTPWIGFCVLRELSFFSTYPSSFMTTISIYLYNSSHYTVAVDHYVGTVHMAFDSLEDIWPLLHDVDIMIIILIFLFILITKDYLLLSLINVWLKHLVGTLWQSSPLIVLIIEVVKPNIRVTIGYTHVVTLVLQHSRYLT